MKRLLLPFLLLFLAACNTTYYTQLFQIKPTSQIKEVDNSLVFENDTVRIVYDFWTEQGSMSWTISNKLNVPIYIDWKKSSYIHDDRKINYWEDETHSTNANFSSGFYYKGFYAGSGHGLSNEFKPQRVEFIPPHSYITVKQFSIFNSGVALEKDKVKYADRPRTDNAKEQTTVFFRNYEPEESVSRFRNFVTVSTSEKFETETRIDNSFFIGQITTMETRQFKGKCDFDKCDYPFEDARRFYINLGSNQSKQVREYYVKNHSNK